MIYIDLVCTMYACIDIIVCMRVIVYMCVHACVYVRMCVRDYVSALCAFSQQLGVTNFKKKIKMHLIQTTAQFHDL